MFPARFSLPATLLAAMYASGCAPSVTMPVLEPALVNVPTEVQKVAVIDRSAPKNLGQSVLGALEGAVTGEGIMADREAAGAALNGLIYILEESPRFEVIVPAVDKKEVNSGIWNDQMEFRLVKKLCREHGCDAIVALEAFDTDVYTDSGLIAEALQYKDESNPEYTHYATRETRVMASWRMYDAGNDRLFDALRDHGYDRNFVERSTTIEAAIAQLPDGNAKVRELGRQAGEEYGRRIAPSWRTVSRTYYAAKDDRLKQAKNHVKAQDWEGAVALWREVAKSDDPKVRGMARFNLALAAEIDGDLDLAVDYAKKAAVDLANGKARGYVSLLEQRRRDWEKLQQQLAPPPEPPPKANDAAADDGRAPTGNAISRPR